MRNNALAFIGVHWNHGNSVNVKTNKHHHHHHHQQQQRQTIVIADTPSPAVSVITISDSSDEERATPKCCKDKNCSACNNTKISKVCSLNSNCPSVLTVTPQEDLYSLQVTPKNNGSNNNNNTNNSSNGGGNNNSGSGGGGRSRKHVISCVTVADSDSEEHYSPVKMVNNFSGTTTAMGFIDFFG